LLVTLWCFPKMGVSSNAPANHLNGGTPGKAPRRACQKTTEQGQVHANQRRPTMLNTNSLWNHALRPN
jgi:hypothetical protein